MKPLDIDSLLNELGVSPDDVEETDATAANSESAPSSPEDKTDAAPVTSEDDPELPAPDDLVDVPPMLDEDPEASDDTSDDNQPAPGPAAPSNAKQPNPAPKATPAPEAHREKIEAPGLTTIFEPESRPDPMTETVRRLLESGAADAKQVRSAQTVAEKSPGSRLLDLLEQQGVEENDLLAAYAAASGMSFRRIEVVEGDDSAWDGVLLQRLGVEYCKDNQVIPLASPDGRVTIGTPQPDDVLALEDVRLTLKAESIRIVAVPSDDIQAVLDTFGIESAGEIDVEDILGDIEEDDVQVEDSDDAEVDLEREAGESPVIRYVNYIIHTAVKEGASDIHIEPGEKKIKVRFRIDGLLFEMMQPPAKMASAITSRLKIMANLDIAERRIPQDGRIRCQVKGRKLDLRVSTIPTAGGEKTVMRILDTKSINVSLDDLGFDEDKLHMWKTQINQPHGIVLVTGPTGSGKTTTLYASLRQMDKTSRNISTVEDPIEYHLDGITQTQTHEKINMTFSRALKALLRQDPDIIMIGEIRDGETAHTAIQAALTGHLVLSTLHTNDAPSAITRLVNIGLEPFLIGAAVNAVLAQRLARRICSNCAATADFNEELRDFIDMQGMDADALLEGKGCDRCRNTGCQGRVGLYELLVIDDLLRDIIARNPNVTEFRRKCIENGMTTLRQDGFNKVQLGQTTVQEILRVTEATM